MKVLAAVIGVLIALSGARATTFEDLAAQASAARDANDVPKAMELYRQALELKPSWAEGWWFLGTLAYDSDQYQRGEKAFQEFVKLDDGKAMGWGFLGLCEFETGKREESLEHLRRALGIGTGIEPAIEQVLKFHEVLLLVKLGLFDQAMPKFMPFVRRGVRNPMLVAAVGLTALRESLLPNEIPPAEQPLVSAAGEAAYQWMAGDQAKTEQAFRALAGNFGKAPGVHYFYGTYLLSFRPAEEGYAEFKRELEVNPHSADARATIALLMVRAGAFAAAMPMAKQAAQDGPACPMAQYSYGVLLEQDGEFAQAIERMQTATRLDPGSIEYHMGLAGAFSRAGRNEEARRERQTSIALARESDGPR
jgi:tetratricopeptide (TPR) repeat protein